MGFADESTIKKYLAKKDLLLLPDRYCKMFEFRNGLFDGKRHTLKETGEKFWVSRERVRQMEARILDMLASPENTNNPDQK